MTTAESMNNSYNVNKYLDCITCGQICCREKGLRHHIRAQHPELIENHIIAFNAGAAAIPAAAAVPPAVNLLVLEAELGGAEGPAGDAEGLADAEAAEEEGAAEALIFDADVDGAEAFVADEGGADAAIEVVPGDNPPLQPVAEQLAAAIPHPAPGAHIALGDLVALFRRGLYTSHKSWKLPLEKILLSVLADTTGNDEDTVTNAIAALQLLPGMIEYCRTARGDGGLPSPVVFLRCVESHPTKVAEIIRWARLWATTLRRRPASEWARTNSEQVRSRIEVLVGQRRYKTASKLLTVLENLLDGIEPAPPMSTAAMNARIAVLHPEANDQDILPDEADDPPVADSSQISASDLRERVYKLKKDSSAGNTGWTNRALRFALEDRDLPGHNGDTPPNSLHVAFQGLCNKMLRGEIRGEGRELMTTARLQMLPKPEGDYRPIRIECAIQRLFHATTQGIAMRTLGNRLRPHQLGGGFRSGAEIAARLMDRAFEQQDALLKLDIRNAYNEVRHRQIFLGIIQMVPGLARLFRWKYGTSSIMRNNDGEIVGHTCTGVGQGDPLGSMFFEIGLQPALLGLAVLLANTEAAVNMERPVLRPGSIVAYEDDTVIRAERDVIFRLAPLVAAHFLEHGFEIKISKCRITGHNTDIEGEQPEEFVIEPDGFTTLGIPIGTPDYRSNSTRDTLLAMAPPMAALRRLKPRSAYQIIAISFNSKPSYVLRAIYDLEAVLPYARNFDTAIINAIAQTFQLALTEQAKANVMTRIFLPKNHGGLGLIKHCGLASEKNQILSRLTFLAFITQYHPLDAALTQEHYNLRPVHMGDSEGIRELTGITEEDMAGLTTINGRATLQKGKLHAGTRIKDILLASLASHGDTRQQAAWLRSTPNTTSDFLDSNAGIEHEKFFSNEAFICAARARLGVGPSEDPDNMLRICACNKRFLAGEDRLHGISCRLNGNLRTNCHNQLRDLLFTLLKKARPRAPIQKEILVGTTALIEGRVIDSIADIVLTDGAIRYCIDVSTIDPASYTCMNHPINSVTLQDASAKSREHTKRHHYSLVQVPNPIPVASVIPFVVEATGRLGPAALTFLHTMCGSQTFLRTRFIDDVVMLFSRTYGKCLVATRERFRQY